MSARPEQVDRLLDRAAHARAAQTAMPWAEPPPQPDPFDARDAEEADDFAARWVKPLTPVTSNPHLFPLRRCDACGYRLNAPGHRRQCEGAA